MENIKDIPGFEGLYAASRDGHIWSYRRNKFLKEGNTRNYAVVVLRKDNKSYTFRVHRLVAMTYIPNPDNLTDVNHKDENGLNNSVDNLEWLSHADNLRYGSRTQRATAKRWGDKIVYCVELDRTFET